MNKKNKLQFLLILFFLVKSINFYSQNQQLHYYKWFDKIVGVGNNGIYNGIEYVKKYRTLEDSHEFYFTLKFLKGAIFYNQQPYYDVEMKYDIFEDDLIVKLPSQYGGNNVIKLIKDHIQSFYLKNKQFVRITINEEENISQLSTGFYELLYSNNLIVYKKYNKSRVERSDKDFIYNIFKDNNKYYLFYNKTYYELKSKKDFIKLFPEQKKNINTFYKINKKLRNSDYDIFLNKLSNHIERLISINTSSI